MLGGGDGICRIKLYSYIVQFLVNIGALYLMMKRNPNFGKIENHKKFDNVVGLNSRPVAFEANALSN